MRLAGLTAAMALVAAACAGAAQSPSAGTAASPTTAAGTPAGPAATATAAAATATAAAPASQPAGETVTFRLTTWAGEDESAELQEIVLDAINSSQSEFAIVHEPAPADYYTKLQTTLAGGTAADFMWLSQEYVAGYASRGALLDLTEPLAAIDSPVAAVDRYFPDVMSTALYEDHVYGLPWISQPVVLYYNPALFDAAGMDYPDDTWDWDTFLTNAKALTKDTDGDGTPDQYGFSANGWPPVHMFIWQAGGDTVSDDLTSSPIDSPEAIAGAEFYKSLIYNPECCPTEDTITEQGFSEMFKAGTVAMFMGGSADTFESADGTVLDIGASVVPMGPTSRTTFAWTGSTVVNSTVENPELAVKALVALTDGIQHWKIVSPNMDLATEEVITASFPDKWKDQKGPQVEAILASTTDMRSFNVIPRQAEWDDLFWREFQDKLYHDQGAAADLAAAARTQLEELLPE
jgi:multiple sugar transport system substrate-binding protein